MQTTSPHNRARGFTLIELLVVISIIGMLASVVLVALQSARQKGIQGAALQFAATNYHAFGSDAYFIYSFDDGSAPTITDYSPSSRNGTLSGTANFITSTPSGSGKALQLDGSANGILVPLTNPINLGSYTFNVWVKITSANQEFGYVTRADTSSYTPLVLALYSTPPSLSYGSCGNVLFGNSTCTFGVSAGNLATIPYTLPLNQWTNVTFSYNSSTGVNTLYINGQKADSHSETASSGQLTVAAVGAAWGGSFFNNFPGAIDDAALYNQSLTDAQVHELYAEGLPSHELAQK